MDRCSHSASNRATIGSIPPSRLFFIAMDGSVSMSVIRCASAQASPSRSQITSMNAAAAESQNPSSPGRASSAVKIRSMTSLR